jgi:glycosyltransferase involved in cell wall biosynthesis
VVESEITMTVEATGRRVPEISVVIASVNGLPYPQACLEAIEQQEGDIPIEVVVADCTGAATVAAIRERFPEVRVLAFTEPMSVPELRAQAIGKAVGRLVAVTEDHCVPRRDWLQQMRLAHQRHGWAAVGGGVVNGAVDTAVDWAAFFCEYSRHIAPVQEGPSASIPGMNVVYDMHALSSMPDLFEEGLWENFIHDRIRAAGYILGLSASVIVFHEKLFTVGMFTSERFHYSRSFAGTRVQGQPFWKRLAWATGSWLLPLLLIGRTTRAVLFRNSGYIRPYLRALPLVCYFCVIWSMGEFVGYLAGPGKSILKVR